MRTCIYGAGAMGTVLGAYLARAGVSVDLVTRNKGHIAGLKAHGAHIVGKVDFIQAVPAFLPEEMEGNYDLIMLMTKQQDNRAVVQSLLPHLSEDGVICTLQNGLPELSVADVIGENRTMGCAVAWGATLIGNGVCELTTEPSRETLSFSLGSFGNVPAAKLAEVKALLEIMGNVTLETNFIGARWAKLVVNGAFSGLSAILNATFGEVAQDRRSRRLAQILIKECIDVAKAAKITIEPLQGHDIAGMFDYRGPLKRWLGFVLIPIAMKKHRNLRASMLQDLLLGKKCEVEGINGVISDYGRRFGCPTPLCDRVISIIREIESGAKKPAWENLALLSELR